MKTCQKCHKDTWTLHDVPGMLGTWEYCGDCAGIPDRPTIINLGMIKTTAELTPPVEVMPVQELTASEFIPLEMPGKYDPTEWQLEDIEYLANQNYSANWSEMGCYKTTTGLWLAEAKIEQVRDDINFTPVILIVSTKSGKGTYFDAIPKSLKGYRVYDVGSTSIAERDSGFEFKIKPDEFLERVKNSDAPVILIAHYHVFANRSKMLPILRQLMYTGIILDEAHRIKEKDNQWTRNLKRLKTWNGFKHVMTGTGFINRPHEMWSLLNFLDPKHFSSYKQFRTMFVDEMTLDNGYTVVYGVKPEMIEEFRGMRKKLGPRRMMIDVHADIKEPVFTRMNVELNPKQRRMYDELKLNLRAMDEAGMSLNSPNVLSMLSRLRQICVATPLVVADYFDEKLDRRVQKIELTEPSSKLDMLMELIDNLEWDDEAKQQVVVFSNFAGPLELLQKRLEKADIEYIWMKASHDDNERYKLWHDVWPEKKHRVFMCTLQLGSESINLSSAQHCVFLDRSWSPKDNNQGVSRVYRPGQQGVAQVIHINALRTTDQRIESSNLTKQTWFEEIFGPDEADIPDPVVPLMDEGHHDQATTLTQLGVDFDELLKQFDSKPDFEGLLDEEENDD